MSSEPISPDAVAKPGRRARVCFVTVEFHGLFKNGGIGTANTALAVALAENGFDVTVAVANADESGPRLKVGDFAELKSHWGTRGITLDYVRPHPHIAGSFDDPRSASYCVFLYLQSGGFDIVLFNDNGGQGYYSLLAKHTGVFENPPLMCVVAHGPIDWVHELNALEYYSRLPVAMSHLERRSAGLADILVSPSRYLLDWMLSRGWVPPGRGHVVQNLLGIDEPQTAGLGPAAGQAVSEIVFFGRQETRKGVTLFCDAIDLLERTTDLRSTRITFLGKFSRIGAMHSGVYVTERARRWRASLRVLAVYDQSDALDYLRRPGVLAVIPSRAENSPCVVAECLLLRLPFLATDSGGTAELVAPEDRELCLFPPEPAALAQRLQEVLRAGHRPAGPAVSQADTLAQWIRLLETSLHNPAPVATPVTGEDESPVVSACVIWSSSRRSRGCLESLRRQTYGRLRTIVAANEDSDRGSLTFADDSGVSVIFGNFASPGAARNAAARHAGGDYLLFVAETAVLLPECVTVLAAAARRTGADIVTGFRQLDAGHKLPKPGAREWELPVGACAELGAVENCFGEGAMLVKASYFAGRPGFAEGYASTALDWLFLAGEVLDGATLEVVPVPLFQLRETSDMDDGERTVEDYRQILRLYRNTPIETISRITECNLRVNAQNVQKMQRALQELGKPARDLALRLASLEASSTEASRLFVQYCCERRMVDLALDFALHNDLPFLPDTVTAASRANEIDARNLVRTRLFDVRHTIDLSQQLHGRARPFYRLRREELRLRPDGGLEHPTHPGDAIIKISGGCPPGVLMMRLTALTGAVGGVRFAGVVCRPWSRPILSEMGIRSDDSVWWSGWVEPTAPGTEFEISIALPQPLNELLDLYFIARRPEVPPVTPSSVTWKAIAAEVCLTGDITPSAIEMATAATPLAADFMTRGELLTDMSNITFPVFVPGVRTLLHPLAGRLALVRVPEALPRRSRGLRCIVSVEHEKAHPIEFGVWARPTSAPVKLAAELGETENFSGWFRVDAPLTKCSFTLLMAEPSKVPMDLYLATRVVDATDAYFCHAYWHEFAVLEEVSSHPADQRLPAAAGADTVSKLPWAGSRSSPPLSRAATRSDHGIRSSYLLCAGARTGSNLLASALRRTGRSGLPFEYFNADLMNDELILRELGIGASAIDVPALAARLDSITRTGTTPNGIFGATVHFWDLERLVAAVAKSQARDIVPLAHAPDGLRSFFPGLRYVWLRRENKIAQAISHYIAAKSNVWHKWVRDPSTGQERVPAVPFDFAAIKEFVATAEAEELGWRNFFASSTQTTFSLTYEELAADYRGSVSRVLAFLGVTLPSGDVPPPAFHRQADARSLEWEQRYRQEEQQVVALRDAQSG